MSAHSFFRRRRRQKKFLVLNVDQIQIRMNGRINLSRERCATKIVSFTKQYISLKKIMQISDTPTNLQVMNSACTMT